MESDQVEEVPEKNRSRKRAARTAHDEAPPQRQRRKIENLELETAASALRDVPVFVEQFESIDADSKIVRCLHKCLFGDEGTSDDRKAAILQWRGASNDDAGERKRITSVLMKCATEDLELICALCEAKFSRSKAASVARVVEFLGDPSGFIPAPISRSTPVSVSKKKRGLVGYQNFKNRRSKELKESGSKKRFADISKAVSNEWKVMSASEKQIWIETAHRPEGEEPAATPTSVPSAEVEETPEAPDVPEVEVAADVQGIAMEVVWLELQAAQSSTGVGTQEASADKTELPVEDDAKEPDEPTSSQAAQTSHAGEDGVVGTVSSAETPETLSELKVSTAPGFGSLDAPLHSDENTEAAAGGCDATAEDAVSLEAMLSFSAEQALAILEPNMEKAGRIFGLESSPVAAPVSGCCYLPQHPPNMSHGHMLPQQQQPLYHQQLYPPYASYDKNHTPTRPGSM